MAFRCILILLLSLGIGCRSNYLPPRGATSGATTAANGTRPSGSGPAAAPLRLAQAEPEGGLEGLVGWSRNFDLPRRLPGPPRRPVSGHPRIAPLRAKIARAQIFAAYRELAELYVQLGRFEDAAATYRAEAAQYRRKGMSDAAQVVERKAARYATQLRLFHDRQATAAELRTLYTGMRLEPFVGTYLGAFIDRDERLPERFFDENWQHHKRAEDFARVTGRPHASLFMYLAYGQKFPAKWIDHCKQNNVIPHLAWEPKNLAAVKNDGYLQGFARECARADWPIFIRFAGEMNGFWTPYHKNPALYRTKFALVHQVLSRAAPKVATIWCVNSVPADNIQAYYPGHNNCDWVGVNLYSVPFFDNDPRRPAADDNPLALLDTVYRLYSARKPIAICEYAASHMAAIDRRLRVDLAIDKIALMYSALPRLYPRIKMINWFNMDNIRNARPGRQLNNYSLTAQTSILNAYRWFVAPAYYLGGPQSWSGGRPNIPRPLPVGLQLRGVNRLSLWLKTYVSRPRVYVQLGQQIIYASNQPGAHILEIDSARLPGGRQPLTVYAYDDRNRFITSSSTSVQIVN